MIEKAARAGTHSRTSWALLGGVLLWNLVLLFPTTNEVAFLNDSAVHEQMVRFASRNLSAGDFPGSHWYSLLNEGSPQFLHYQPLGALTFGFFGTFLNADIVFHWSTYLLIALWPIVIYASARIFRIPQLAAAFAAVVSPFLMSVPGVGYEQKAYLWVGYGLWAQLCGSWCLPFAWATTWRALEDRRWLFPASIAIAATVACHFETGYLALAAVLVMPLARWKGLRARATNGLFLLAGSLVGASWVLVPLLLNSKWAAVNTYLSRTGLVRGYGARQDLTWLITGQTFDAGRLPVVTIAVFAALLLGFVFFRNFEGFRPAAAMFFVSLLLSFGPTTWGPMADLVPGHADIFFRRFLVGVHLSGIYLAGIGIYLSATWIANRIARYKRPRQTHTSDHALETVRFAVALGLIGLLIVPALIQLDHYDNHNATFISQQARAQKELNPQLAPILAYLRAHPDGRVFAGSPRVSSDRLFVGRVPMYEYLANFDIDVVGFTLRTASLMSQPENNFVPTNVSDYEVFGARYLLLRTGLKPPVAALRTMTRGPFTLWTVSSVGYLSLVRSAGTETEDRATIGPLSIPLLRSHHFAQHLDPVVMWTNTPDRSTLVRSRQLSGPVGRVDHVRPDIASGSISAVARVSTPTIVVLSASYDPGWRAWVNGNRVPTVAMAPALVGVRIPDGTSTVRFSYAGFNWYPELIILSCIGPGALYFIARPRRRRSARIESS